MIVQGHAKLQTNENKNVKCIEKSLEIKPLQAAPRTLLFIILIQLHCPSYAA